MLNAEPRRQRDGIVLTPESYVDGLFCFAVNAWTASRRGEFNVRVERRGLAAAFSVQRAVEFFRDRRTGLARDGRRERIFHSVAEHRRVLADGREVLVPGHFRGERHFSWQGYSVAVTAPGRMHLDVLKFNAAMVDEEEIDPAELHDYLDPGEVGARLVAESERRLQAMPAQCEE